MPSHDQVPRLLLLVPYLRQHPNVPVATVAAAFGVSSAQVRSDLAVLWMCGLPGGMPGDLIDIDMEAVEGEGLITLTNADYLARPMRFTMDEALSLVLALRTLRDVVGPELRSSVESALATFEQLIAPGERARVQVAVDAGEQDVRDRLSAAISAQLRVRLTYDGVNRGLTTRPLVDPRRVAVRDGYAYLDAWSVERSAWRTYRLDRIAAVDVLDVPAEPHPGGPDDAERWLDRLAGAASVRLWLADEARWVCEYYPTVSVEPRKDGVVATFRVADPAWLRGLLLRLGSRARMVEPVDAGTSAADAARAALDMYERLDPERL